MNLFDRIKHAIARPVVFLDPDDSPKNYPNNAIIFRSQVPPDVTLKDGSVALFVYIDDRLVATLFENDRDMIGITGELADMYEEDTMELDRLILMPILHTLTNITDNHSIHVDRMLVVTKNVRDMA